jgi:hypothetical protein
MSHILFLVNPRFLMDIILLPKEYLAISLLKGKTVLLRLSACLLPEDSISSKWYIFLPSWQNLICTVFKLIIIASHLTIV